MSTTKQKFQKTSKLGVLLACLSFLTCAPAFATNYFFVAPLSGKVANIVVSLNPTVIPSAPVNFAYTFNVTSVLQVTGDAGFNPANATWSVTSGVLPAGLAFSPAGVFTGTPTAEGVSELTLTATYKSKTGSRAYSFNVVLPSSFLLTGKEMDATPGSFLAVQPTVGSGVTSFGSPTLGADGLTVINGSGINIPPDAAIFRSGDFTVDFWIYLRGPLGGGQYTLLLNNSASSFVMQLGDSGYSNSLLVNVPGHTHIVVQGVNKTTLANSWHHIAIVRKDGNVKSYMDGVPKAQYNGGNGVYGWGANFLATSTGVPRVADISAAVASSLKLAPPPYGAYSALSASFKQVRFTNAARWSNDVTSFTPPSKD